jgi:hypothetical protein
LRTVELMAAGHGIAPSLPILIRTDLHAMLFSTTEA